MGRWRVAAWCVQEIFVVRRREVRYTVMMMTMTMMMMMVVVVVVSREKLEK